MSLINFDLVSYVNLWVYVNLSIKVRCCWNEGANPLVASLFRIHHYFFAKLFSQCYFRKVIFAKLFSQSYFRKVIFAKLFSSQSHFAKSPAVYLTPSDLCPPVFFEYIVISSQSISDFEYPRISSLFRIHRIHRYFFAKLFSSDIN